jgi:xanthine dehydrogenase molybdenum-binding subunit
MPDAKLTSVGSRTGRLNGPTIVTGQILYADDVQLPGMLHGALLRSPHGHTRIKKIDTSAAKALPGVIDVITAKDTPGLSIFANEEVTFQGQKIGAVAALDADIARDAVALIKVDYTVLPAVADPVEAMQPDAPEAVIGAPCEDLKAPDGRAYRNIGNRGSIEEGDVEAGFAEADAIVEFEYRAPYWNQTYMEPNSSTARLEPNGRLTVWTSCQGAFNIRDGLAGALKIPVGKIKVIAVEMGGGFGAKNGMFVEPQAALLAMRTGTAGQDYDEPR